MIGLLRVNKKDPHLKATVGDEDKGFAQLELACEVGSFASLDPV